MAERTYTFEDADKSTWGEGPWQNEPDKVVWVDDATGLDCMIVRNRLGALCGYVGVPEGHPWHGVNYNDVSVKVHGGLTYSAPCEEDARECDHTVCHTELPGRPEHVWWLGFDCAHGFDFAPAMVARDRERGHYYHDPSEEYRDLGYVKADVISLAEQAIRATTREVRVT